MQRCLRCRVSNSKDRKKEPGNPCQKSKDAKPAKPLRNPCQIVLVYSDVCPEPFEVIYDYEAVIDLGSMPLDRCGAVANVDADWSGAPPCSAG
jgi:hypothetical protein